MGRTASLAWLGAAVVAALAAPATRERSRRKRGLSDEGKRDLEILRGLTTTSTWRSKISSHEAFTHDSIDSLGYDWERIANPTIAPKYPLKVYLPQTTEDLVRIVKDAKTLGERLVVRSKGHSSNGLVLADRGSVIVTEKLAGLVELDEENLTATVLAGTVSAEIDEYLAGKGYGLPVIGDHNHITVGGFASVGGISPASHRFGLFVDNVEALEYVDWDGQVHACSRTSNSDRFYKVLTGLGKYGVIATMTLRIIPIDKYGTVWVNDQKHYRSLERFIEGSYAAISDPGDALMERGVWVDFARRGRAALAFGQFSAYHEVDQTPYRRLRDRASYGWLHRVGYFAGRLPPRIDRLLKYVGMTGVLFSPKYASIKNIEFFTDKILDSTVADPTRMFIALGPLERYRELFRELWDLSIRYREEHGCFTFVSVYVKSIRSPYLAKSGRDRFCELMFYCGIDSRGMTADVLEAFVSEFDDVCIAYDALRYMHSRTVQDEERRRRLDPNALYDEPPGAATANGDAQLGARRVEA